MRRSEQRLSPDTCGCKIRQWWDKSEPLETRVVHLDYFETQCPVHAGLSHKDAWACIWLDDDSEQKRKNGIHKELLENDELGVNREVPQGDGTLVNELDEGVVWTWKFDDTTGPNRLLSVYLHRVIPATRVGEAPGFARALSSGAQAQLERIAETRWPGKVRVL